MDVTAQDDAMPVTAAPAEAAGLDALFLTHYSHIARVVGRVVRDRARAEELAVDVFLKWRRHPEAQGEGAVGWLYRAAVRMGLDELRRQARRERFERWACLVRGAPRTPAEVHEVADGRQQVRAVLRRLKRRDAALLLLRNEGLSYDELATALGLRPQSIGTFIARAQRAFRIEYERRYGTSRPGTH